MTDQTNAELIEEARTHVTDEYITPDTSAEESLIRRLASALEDAEKRATYPEAERSFLSVEWERIAKSQRQTINRLGQERDEARKAAEDHVLDADAVHVRLSAELREVRRERDNWKLSAEEAEKAEKRWKDRAEEAERELQVAEDQANNLAGDLAQAEKERDSAMASYKDYMTLLRKAAELSAVVEKARAVIECESGWFRYRAGRVLDILATAPADALREVKATAWDEGVNAEARAAVTASPRIKNPYRKEQGREG